jgi:hypothetical protein
MGKTLPEYQWRDLFTRTTATNWYLPGPRGQPEAVPANVTTKDLSSSHTIPNNESKTEAEVPERQVESDYDNVIEEASVAQLQK